MTKSNNADLLEGDIKLTLVKITIPMILGLVMLMTFNIADTYFVGMLGTSELAALSFTFPITFTIMSLNIGLAIGTSAVIGKYVGSKQIAHAKRMGTGALMLSVLLVALLAFITYLLHDPIFTAMGASTATLPLIRDYMEIWLLSGVLLAIPMVGNAVLRANGDTVTPSIIMGVGGFINVLLDPLFIFGAGPIPQLGIQGAAIATVIAWVVASFVVLYLLAYKRQLIEAKILGFKEFIHTSKGVTGIGLPAAGANMLTPIAGAVLTSIVAVYGEPAVAAWGVGYRLESIGSIIILALSMSLPPFISQNYGANNWQRIQSAYCLCMRFVMILQFGVFLLFALLAIPISTAFAAEDEEVRAIIRLFLFIVPLGYGLQGVVILTNSSLNAIHSPMVALVLSLVRLFVCLIPITYVGSQLFDLLGLFWGCVIANTITAVVAYWWFHRELSKQQSLTHPICE